MDEMEEMVRLLLSRGKMLNLHCPKCNLPLFQTEGGVVCVKCGGVRIEKPEETSSKVGGDVSEDLLAVLKKKRAELLHLLENESDPDKIGSIVESISKIDSRLRK